MGSTRVQGIRGPLVYLIGGGEPRVPDSGRREQHDSHRGTRARTRVLCASVYETEMRVIKASMGPGDY